jgi:DNA-binding response OmpR family regulator
MRKTLLIIAADKLLVESLHRVLSHDFNLHIASNGYDALEWMQRGNYAHLMIVDSDVQVLNPYDIKECIVKLNGMTDIPVFYLSSRPTHSEFIKDEFCMTKPFHAEKLAGKIIHLLYEQENHPI